MAPGNYRPFGPASITAKIMAKLIRDSINKELNDRNIINASQHNFMENRPCQTNLILLCDEITNLVDERNCPEVIGLDLWRQSEGHKSLE